MVQNIFNDNPESIFEMISPIVIRGVTSYGKLLINGVLSTIPYDELLKE